MRILLIGKLPPIQGGVSSQLLNTVKSLGVRGHEVVVITNAGEVEVGYRACEEAEISRVLDQLPNVSIIRTTPVQPRAYIPSSKPFASQLFGRASAAMRRNSFDCVVGYYFEPYGFVAALVAQLYSVPLILVHAGSDLAKLALHPDLALTYEWMLARCDVLITGRSEAVRDALATLKASEKKFVHLRLCSLPDYFREPTRTGTLEDLRQQGLSPELKKYLPLPDAYIEKVWKLNRNRIDTSSTKILVYGKLNPFKGVLQLIEALGTLRQFDYHLVIIAAGDEAFQEKVVDAIFSNLIDDRAAFLPSAPPWRIPSIISECDIVAAMENNFPVKIHAPLVSREAMSRGACVLMSREIFNKQIYNASLVDRKNVVLVEDPGDVVDVAGRLRELMETPALIRYIGTNARLLSATNEGFYSDDDSLADAIIDLSTELRERHLA